MAFAMSEEERKRQALANYALQQGNINLRVKDIPKAPGVTVTDQPQRYSVKVGPSMQVEPIKVSTPYSVRNFLAGQNDKYSSMPSYNKGIIGFLEKKYDAVNANSPQDIFKRSLQGQQASYEGPNFGGRLRDMSVGALRETAKIPENIYRSIDEASSTIEAQKINDAINEKDPAKKRIKISKISDPRGPLVKLGKTKTLDSNMSDDELIKIRNELLQKRTAAPKYTEGAKRFLYGSEPVQSYQQRARGLREELATGTSVAQQALGTEGTAGKVTKFLKEKAAIIAPALAGLTVIGDVTPVGKSKNAAKLPKEDLKILSKSVDPNEVKAVVSKNNIELSDNAVKDIVEAKNTKTVNKIIGEDLKAASDNIAKEADNLVGQKIDNQNITNVAKTTEPTRNEAVSDAVVTELVKTKTPQEVTDAVDALFPTLPKEEKINLTNKIAQTQDVNQIKQLVEEAKARETQLKETVQVNTPEQVATTQAEQTQQAMEQAVPAPKPAPESTQAPIIQEPTTTAPDGVQGATAADNVPGAAPVEKTALTPREEIKIINRKAAHRGDKYTISEEKRIAELQKQINEEPTQKTSPVNGTQRLDRPVTVEDWVNRGYTRERAEKIVQHKQTVNMLNDEWAGKQINDGMNAEVISAEDMRLDKTKPGREIITSVQDYKIYKDNSGNEHYRLKINKQIVDHTPETAQKRIDALEKQKAFMGELPEPLQKELDQLHGIDGKAMSVEPKSAPVEKTAPKFTIAGASQGMDGTLTKINNAPLTKEEINAGGAYAPSHPLYEKSVDSTPLVDIPPVTPDLTAPVPQSFGEMLGEKAGKFWQRFKEQVYDPLSPWQRAEDARNRALGVKMKNADASRSFTHLLNQIVVSDQNTLRNLTAKQPTGQSVARPSLLP